MTTIYSDPASVGEWLYAKVNPEAGIVPGEQARPRNVGEKQYQKLLVTMMDESKVARRWWPCVRRGMTKVTGQGAQVQELADTSKAKGLLRPGDVIVEADGQPITTSNDLVALIQAHRPGETMRLAVKRGEETLAVEIPLGSPQMSPAGRG